MLLGDKGEDDKEGDGENYLQRFLNLVNHCEHLKSFVKPSTKLPSETHSNVKIKEKYIYSNE